MIGFMLIGEIEEKTNTRFKNVDDFEQYIEAKDNSGSYGDVSAERFNRTIRELLKKTVSQQGDAKWIDTLTTKTKQYKNRVHTSTRLSSKDASLKKKEGFVYKNLLDKRKKMKPKFQVNNLVKTAVLRETFSKGGTTNWSQKLYRITEIVNDKKPS